MISGRADHLIIGYGNPIRGDDAVGLRVAEAARAAGCNAIAVLQLLPELAEPVSQASRVLFIDCDIRLAPGQVAISEPEAAAGWHAPTSPAGLLELARELYSQAPPALCIGIGPETLELGETLSPIVQKALPEALRLTVQCSTSCSSSEHTATGPAS